MNEFDYSIPKVALPDNEDGTFPPLTPEQFVVWFRTQSTASQIRTAAAILDVKPHLANPVKVVDGGGVAYDVDSLRNTLLALQDNLRAVLEESRTLKGSYKRRCTLLTERVIALGVAIKEMGL